MSNEDGRFNMLNMRVGVTKTLLCGFQTQIYNEVYLELGKPLNLDAILKDESQQLSEVMVTGAKSKVLVVVGRCGDYNRKKRANCLPTISRSAEDFYAIRTIR
jgi:hypothetical protein